LVTVARLNSAEVLLIFSRWEANSGFQGAGVVGVGWEVDIVWRRRWVRREVVVRTARVLNWSMGYCCTIWVFLDSNCDSELGCCGGLDIKYFGKIWLTSRASCNDVEKL
jgi:hypothetical protein